MAKVQGEAAAAGSRGLVAGAMAGVLLASAGAALATTGQRADFDLGFDTGKPGTKAALVLHVVYKAAGDPDAKPSPIRKVVIAAPAGTRFDTNAVPPCKASDDDLKAQGSSACPTESRIGAGKLSADTGFGPPADPTEADLTLFNTGDAVLEVVTAEGTDRVLGTDRLHIDGSTLTGAPPVTPGGPPDGETAVRQIDFTIDKSTGFVTTPGTCTGQWISTGTFGFKDGAEETLQSAAACERKAVAKPRLMLAPTRVRVGRASRFTARVEDATPVCTRGVVVRVGGRRARTDGHGRVRLTVTAHRGGAHSATAKKRGCPTLRTGFVAVA
jgi:hypothetical protein